MDPAILSCGPRPTSTPPIGSKLADQSLAARNDSPSSDIIRYSRERLLGLRNTEMSRRKPDYIDDRRFWCRLGNPNGGSDNADNSSGLSRYEGRSDYHRGKPSSTTLSASSSTSSLANSSSSSYLLPSFACKRRPTGSTTGTNSTETKDRLSTGLRKEATSADQTPRRDGTSGDVVKSVMNYRKSGNSDSTGEALGRDRRIGSGRIPMRDVSWNDYKSTTSDKDSNAPPFSDGVTDSSGGDDSRFGSHAKRMSAASEKHHEGSRRVENAAGKGSFSASGRFCFPSGGSDAQKGLPAADLDAAGDNEDDNGGGGGGGGSGGGGGGSNSGTHQTTVNESEYNFRPSGGLLGLRDRERGGESQTTSTTSHQQHPILPRSLIDKDRNDYRSDRSNIMNDDRYDRRPFNRDYNLGSMDKERNMRGASSMNHHHNSNSNSRYGSNNSHYNNNSSNHYQSNQHHHGDHRRRMYESRQQPIEEPEWFSGGPTSQNDVIELRGFDDPPASSSDTKSPTQEYDDYGSTGRGDGTYRERSQNDDSFDDENSDDNKVTEDDQNVQSTKLSSDSNNNKDADGAKNSQKTKKRSTESESGNDGDGEDNSNDVNKNKENFNFEDFLKLDSITDLLSVR